MAEIEVSWHGKFSETFVIESRFLDFFLHAYPRKWPCVNEQFYQFFFMKHKITHHNNIRVVSLLLSFSTWDAIEALLKIYKSDMLGLIFDEKSGVQSDFEWMISAESHTIQRTTMVRIFCYIFENCPIENTESIMMGVVERLLVCMTVRI